MILAGDIGGTNTRLAVCEPSAEGVRVLADAKFPSRGHASLEEIVRAFLGGVARGHAIEVACFGIAGPVKDGRCEATNLPWVIDARATSAALGIGETLLLNDLEANAYGIAALGPDDLVTLNEGAPGARGNACVIAAGTGLGEAGLFWSGAAHEPFACEGGHATFAPRDALDLEMLRFLLLRYPGHVSFERVLSGPGLVNTYEFLRDTEAGRAHVRARAPGGAVEPLEPEWLRQELASGDRAATISRSAARSPLCDAAMDRFVATYGAEAANLALKTLALAGVYLGGGIAPKILERLRGPSFREAFLAKGRMRPLLESMPVRVIRNPDTALLGAARRGAMRAKAAGKA